MAACRQKSCRRGSHTRPAARATPLHVLAMEDFQRHVSGQESNSTDPTLVQMMSQMDQKMNAMMQNMNAMQEEIQVLQNRAVANMSLSAAGLRLHATKADARPSAHPLLQPIQQVAASAPRSKAAMDRQRHQQRALLKRAKVKRSRHAREQGAPQDDGSITQLPFSVAESASQHPQASPRMSIQAEERVAPPQSDRDAPAVSNAMQFGSTHPTPAPPLLNVQPAAATASQLAAARSMLVDAQTGTSPSSAAAEIVYDYPGEHPILTAYTMKADRTGTPSQSGGDLLLLLEEWEEGILLGSQRSKPVWQLEFDMTRLGGSKWRHGQKICKAIQLRKTLIYEIYRRAGHRRCDVKVPHTAALSACAELAAMRRQDAGQSSSRRQPARLLSLDKLCQKLGGDQSPSEFEKHVLGWQGLACMAKGNPRKLAQQRAQQHEAVST